MVVFSTRYTDHKHLLRVGTTPQIEASGVSSPKASDIFEAAREVQTGPLAVADMMARLQRLKATKKY